MAQDHAHDLHVKYQENKGQWNNDLFFFGQAANMDIMVGDGKFMLQLKSQEDFDLIGDHHHGWAEMPDDFMVRFHNIEFDLINSNTTRPVGQKKTHDYINYFIGNDPNKWAGGIKQFSEIRMPEVYPNVDFLLSSIGSHMKYEFRLASGANLENVKFKISGADRLYLEENRLHIANSVDLLIDEKPIAWQIINGAKVFVKCQYMLDQDTLGFKVDDYQPEHPLIIDPTLIFSSYTGSTTDNWGSTATYDSLGNLYAGGIVVSTGGSMNGYPTSTGAFQTQYQGGGTGLGTDIVISKFEDDGSNLIYSTYLGGNNNEIPHSLVVNSNNHLYILGTTSSTNFPVTNSAFDGTFNGGSSIGTGNGGNNNSNGIGYSNGSDIIIAKFNANGTGLIGCTYVGGSGNDGINLSDTLQKAYSDEYRGEIIVDANDNCYIATSTGSSNFPIVNGFQNSYGGGLTDGIVFKFNSNLTSLLWSSYIGGSEADAAYSLQFDPNLNVFATGGTKSNDFPTTSGVLHSTAPQGSTIGADGWVSKISNNGQNLLASTYLGTSSYDQSFFVQLDLQGNVYCVGQSLGSYPIGPSWVYSVNNSGQFLHKLTNNLQNTVFSTRWGSGNNSINLSLSAFLVNQCNHIFIAGWGGSLFGTNSMTSGASTTNGLPTTNNAVQTSTDGSDMYFMVLEDSATGVLFGSYYGGTSTSTGREHVDGGTSRFDKKGIIYQAVCAGCGGGGGNSFPTTTGAHATTNLSSNCNLGAIKYDLVTLESGADIDGPTEICVNDSIDFLNESFGGSLYLWDFGDGNFSTEYEPSYAYSSPGNYDVILIIYDSVSCIFADTDTIALTVIPGPVAVVPNLPKVCPDTPVQLSASGGQTYAWSPAGNLNDPNIADPIAEVEISTTFIVSVTDSCGTDTAHLRLVVFIDETDAMDDTALCEGLSVRLRAEGGVSYSWSPGIFLSSTTSARPFCSPDTTTDYIVTIIDSFQCERDHPVKVFVEGFIPQIKAHGDTTICPGDRVLLSASGAKNYSWKPTTWLLDSLLQTTPAYPEESIQYVVRSFNSCGEAFDTVTILIRLPDLVVDPDTAVCLGDSVELSASGALIYKWTGPEFERPNYNRNPSFLPSESSWYYITGSNIERCEGDDSIYVTVHPQAELNLLTNPDTISGLYNVLLAVESSGIINWSSSGYVPCKTCDSIQVYPLYDTKYFVEVVDSNTCRSIDSISVKAISKLYVPSTFTPNGDGFNDQMQILGHNILKFHISVRDRWGQLVFESYEMSRMWDGTKFNKGDILPDGVYPYDITYTVLPEQELQKTGTITLLK